MKKYLLSMLIAIAGCTMALGAEPDMLVTQSGEIFKVYNLDISVGDKIYYTLDESEDAPLQKINKSDVLVLKKADGSIVNFNQVAEPTAAKAPEKAVSKNPAVHEPITHKAIENDFFVVEKQKKAPTEEGKYILVSDGKDQILNMKVLSEENRLLSIWKPRKGYKYDLTAYIIPEYVIIGEDKYTVEEIGPGAFKSNKKITDILFPETLKSIRPSAFDNCRHLGRIILPESLEYIGGGAFYRGGMGCSTFEQLYIPKGVKKIESEAFRFVGPKSSWNGYFQGSLTCIPEFVTTGNCTSFGIDEEAVEAYEKRRK